jgi:hypothetical protein
MIHGSQNVFCVLTWLGRILVNFIPSYRSLYHLAYMCTAQVLIRFCHLIKRSFACKAKEGRHIKIKYNSWNLIMLSKCIEYFPSSSGASEFTPGISEVCIAQPLVIGVLLCRSLFVPLSLFFWQLYCLSSSDNGVCCVNSGQNHPLLYSNIVFLSMLMYYLYI